MKLARGVVKVLAGVLPLPLILIAASTLFVFALSQPQTKPQERSDYTKEQQAHIAEALLLELAPEETITTSLWPGFGQGKGSLTITVHGVASEEDFLSRLLVEKELGENGTYYLFGKHGDGEQSFYLTFANDQAALFIGGRIYADVPGLSDVVWNLVYIEPTMPLLSEVAMLVLLNPIILGGTLLELALILFLIFSKQTKENQNETNHSHRRPPQRGEIDAV